MSREHEHYSLPFHKTLKESGTFCNNSFYRRHNDAIELTIPHGEAVTGAMLPYNVKKIIWITSDDRFIYIHYIAEEMNK